MEKNKRDLIFARLKLGQELLEESDRLEGHAAYDFKTVEDGKPFYHPRHERESLVIYLLLTCFDLLGQPQKVISFDSWLESKKEPYKTERESFLSLLSKDLDYSSVSMQLFKKYKEIYGVKNAFYNGVLQMSKEIKNELFKSIRVSFIKNYADKPKNVISPSKPIEDERKELDLKLRYLYNKRNSFTHKLDQHHSCSTPMMSDFKFNDGASWSVMFKDPKLIYMGIQQNVEMINKKDAYVYSTSNWPFILFETLYKVLEIPFDRTDINLLFQVELWHKNNKSVTTYNNVKHKDILSLCR